MKNGNLALTRKIGEQTIIQFECNGELIELVQTIIDIDRGQVRMLFDAPKEVKITRSELISHD